MLLGLVPLTPSSFSFFILFRALFVADTKGYLPAHILSWEKRFITWGNRKMNADRDADELFSSSLPLTRSDSAL